MKAWQVLVIGTAVLTALVLLPLYERVLAGCAAILVVGAVTAGFFVRPRQDVFYIFTHADYAFDREFFRERDCLAIRIELTRLWILFLPTFLALAFLLGTFAQGMLWSVSLLRALEDLNFVAIYLGRFFYMFVIALLSMWLSERFVLRDAEAGTAHRMYGSTGRGLSYVFIARDGDYYVGSGVCLFALKSRHLENIVFYRRGNPESNKALIGCLFHRAVIIGHGIPELNYKTVPIGARLAPRRLTERCANKPLLHTDSQ